MMSRFDARCFPASSVALLFAMTAMAATSADAITNSVGMKLVPVPAGTFVMGSPSDEKGHQYDEPQRKVTLTKPFFIGATEVTKEQWKAVMDSARGAFEGANLPVQEISWTDALAFCRKLSAKEGRTYRLPTEAEWEYACRAGGAERFSGGGAGDMAWFDDNADDQPHPVATKKPNAWGLYDMHGNVAEWCADNCAPNVDAADATDPAGPPQGTTKVVRGGSFQATERGCRCAARASAGIAHQLKSVGFRVVLEK